MRSFGHNRQRRWVALFFVVSTCVAGIAGADPVIPTPDGARIPFGKPNTPSRPDAPDAASIRRAHIVRFAEPPLALYRGDDARFRAPARRANGRLDARAPEARAYVEHLRQSQAVELEAARKAIGRTLAAEHSFQHALNAVVLELSGAEAERIAHLPGVVAVEETTDRRLSSDTGPGFIGAPGLWSGANVPSGVGSKGEGVVIAVVDSGINFASPSFAATEPGSSATPGGYVHVNPLGVGTFLGSCAPGGADAGRCNAKLIGAGDFAYAAICTPAAPATDPCRSTANGGTVVETASAIDDNGHGTHAAGVAAGNAVNAPLENVTVAVSGVAPHANLLAYDVCYQRVADGSDVCPEAASVAAIDRIVADGVADVIGYSIGGGATPWQDAVSLAMLGAQNAGIVVSAAAGNAGPQTGTLDHVEPWVMSVGATTHDRVFGFRFDLTGPAGAPPATQDITVLPGGTPVATTPVAAPLIVSPTFASPNDDGCAPFAANTFRRPATSGGTSGIAVLALRSTGSACGSINRRAAALDAGAIAVLFVVDVPLDLLASDSTFQMLLSDWSAVAAHVATASGAATASIGAPISRRLTAQSDVVATFSSRGAALFDALKPDLAAPGVDIFAATFGPSDAYDPMSGTSMSNAHAAGAAALLRAINPAWSPSELKSALMLTTRTAGVVAEDGVTPATPFERGAGRIDLTSAAKAGLLFDETGAHYDAADPATGGDPRTLNLPSIQDGACVGRCTFTRTVRNARATAATYTLAATGLPAGAVTYTPSSSLNVVGGGTATFTVAIDGELLFNTWNHGAITLTPQAAGLPTLHLPVSVRPSGPDVATSLDSISVTLEPNTTTSRALTVRNDGNPELHWSVGAGTQTTTLFTAPPSSAGAGAGFHAGLGFGRYLAEDFDVFGSTALRTLRANGFVLPAGVHLTPGSAPGGVSFRIYADASGKPAGAPEGVGAPPLFSYDAPVNGAGVSVAGEAIALDLAAAGYPPVTLPNGRYWLVVYPSLIGNGSGTSDVNPLWGWRYSTAAPQGDPARTITPTVAASWTTLGANGLSAGVTGQVDCAQPAWVSYDVTSGVLRLDGESLVNVTFDSTGLAAGTHRGFLCIATNGTDPDEAYAIVGLTLVVPSAPTGNGQALPSSVYAGDGTLLTVQLVAATSPASTGVTMQTNLSAIGGSAMQQLYDDGTHGDATSGDGTFSFAATVAPGTAPASLTLPVSIADAQARSGSASIALRILTPNAPSGVASASPSSVAPGGLVLVTVAAVGASDPVSTGLTATVDLTAIGGSATQPMYDDGTHGDATASDGVYSVEATVGAATGLGVKALAVTVRDAQNRSGTASATLTVAGDLLFANGFE